MAPSVSAMSDELRASLQALDEVLYQYDLEIDKMKKKSEIPADKMAQQEQQLRRQQQQMQQQHMQQLHQQQLQMQQQQLQQQQLQQQFHQQQQMAPQNGGKGGWKGRKKIIGNGFLMDVGVPVQSITEGSPDVSLLNRHVRH